MSLHRPNPPLGGKPISQINMTPFVGVLLAVFVVVAMTRPPELGAIGIDMPPWDCFGACDSGPPPVLLSIQFGGVATVDGVPVASRDLKAALIQARGGSMDTVPIIVRADADVPYGEVFRVYGDIQAAGLGDHMMLMNEDIE